MRRRLFLRTKTDNRGPGATGKRDRGVLLSRYIVLSDAVSVSAIYDRPRTLSRPRPRGVVPPVCSGHRVDETAVLANRCEKVCGVSTCFAGRHPLARNLSQSVARVFTAYDRAIHTDGRYLPYLSRDNTVARPPRHCHRAVCVRIFSRARARDCATPERYTITTTAVIVRRHCPTRLSRRPPARYPYPRTRAR